MLLFLDQFIIGQITYSGCSLYINSYIQLPNKSIFKWR